MLARQSLSRTPSPGRTKVRAEKEAEPALVETAVHRLTRGGSGLLELLGPTDHAR